MVLGCGGGWTDWLVGEREREREREREMEKKRWIRIVKRESVDVWWWEKKTNKILKCKTTITVYINMVTVAFVHMRLL